MADVSSIFKSNFSSFITTLKDSSLDDRDKSLTSQYLCQDETQKVYNFDKIVKEKYPKKQPSSYDALLIEDKIIYCIEFKNQKYSDIDTKEVQKKIINGKDVLDNIFLEYNIQKRDYKFIYCVIYKNHPPKWRRGITKNIVQFELEQYKGRYFDEVYTNDVQYFTHQYKKYFQKKLSC